MRWTHVELTWHDTNMWRHHGSRHKHMRAHLGAYLVRWVNWAKSIGPTSMVGLLEVKIARGVGGGGCTKAQWATQTHKGVSSYIRDKLS